MMKNELLLLGMLVLLYGAILLADRFLGSAGLIALNVLVSVLANIEVLMLVRAFGMEMTLGNVPFAATFLITDLLSETRGKKQAQQAVYAGVAANVLFVLVTQSWLLYQPSVNDWAQPSLQSIFANTPRLVLASLTVYLVAQLLDVWLYHRWWALTERWTGNRRAMLWLRNNGSTLLSQLVNAVLYNVLAFGGMYDRVTLLFITLSSYGIFVVTSLLDTPVVYVGRYLYEKRTKKKSSVIQETCPR